MNDLVDSGIFYKLLAEAIVVLSESHYKRCNSHSFNEDCPQYRMWRKQLSPSFEEQKGPIWNE